MLVAALLSGIESGDLLAAIIFVIASITDALDGYIARRNKDVTTFGKLMDPLADKLLVTSALVSLVSLDRLQAWVAMVIIAREFAVTGLRQLAMEHGEVIHASGLGQGQDGGPDRDGARADPRRQLAAVGRRARLRDGRAITIASAVDYFFSFRQIWFTRGRRATRAWRRDARSASPEASSRRISPSRPKRSATTLCWWIVSRFSWRA